MLDGERWWARREVKAYKAASSSSSRPGNRQGAKLKARDFPA
jgi:hypothetical protein